MSIELLKEYVDFGREIEFQYRGKNFSVTYATIAPMGHIISFCEFYQKPVDVKTVDELLQAKWNGEKFADIWESLTEEDIWIY